MRWPAKLGIGVLVVIALVVLAYVILFPVHNWRLKHRIWVAFGVQANSLEVVDLPVAEREGGRIFSVPALETAAPPGLPVVPFRPPFVYGARTNYSREHFFWARLRAGRP